MSTPDISNWIWPDVEQERLPLRGLPIDPQFAGDLLYVSDSPFPGSTVGAGTPKIALNAKGLAFSGNGSSYFSVPSRTYTSNSSGAGYSFLFVAAAPSTTKSMICGDSSNNNFIWLNNGSGAITLRAAANTANFSGAATTALGVYVLTVGSGNATLYSAGKLLGTVVTGGFYNFTLTEIGNGYSATTYALNGQLNLLHIMPRTLSVAEAMALSANPALIFQPTPLGTWMPSSGGSGITASLASTDGADVLNASGALSISALLASTDGSDVLAASGSLAISGASATTDGADSLAASGALSLSGSLAATDGADALSSAGALSIAGSVAATDGADAISTSGSLNISGSVAVTDGADVLSASGVIGSAILGSVAATDGPDTPSASGALAISGSVSATDGADSASASGSLAISASLAKTDGPDTLSAAALVVLSGSINVADGPDILAASGIVPTGITGSVSVTDGADTANGSASLLISGALNQTDGADILSAYGVGGSTLAYPNAYTLVVPAESRRLVVPAENRLLVVPYENRRLIVPAD